MLILRFRNFKSQFQISILNNIVSTAHLHFPFQNGDVPRCEHYIRGEDDGGHHSEKEKEYFMVDDQGDEENGFKGNQERNSTITYDLRKGACNFSDDTANLDSSLLYQSRSHDNSQDEDDNERVVMRPLT